MTPHFARMRSRTRSLAFVLATALLPGACAGTMARPEVGSPAPVAAATADSLATIWGDAPAAVATGSGPADLAYLRERQLLVPVAGVRPDQVPDSYSAGRSGGRRHNAVDIMAPRGTPVLSADAGRILRMSNNAAGGITIHAVDPRERVVYYYAHLDRYRAGLAAGMPVARGDTLGFVGTTGNAPKHIPHLHFQVTTMPTDRKWWTGVPIDPRPAWTPAGPVARQGGGQ